MDAPPSPVKVVVVATNPATRDPLLSYFREAGVSADGGGCASDIGRASLAATALIVFPDELELDAVLGELAAARAARPEVLVLLVTSSPKRYANLGASASSPPPRVLAKPVFGWTLLDAIRAHVDGVAP